MSNKRSTTLEGFEITNEQPLRRLSWCEAVVVAVNRDPAREAYVKTSGDVCQVFDWNPPKLIVSTYLDDAVRNKKFRGELPKT